MAVWLLTLLLWVYLHVQVNGYLSTDTLISGSSSTGDPYQNMHNMDPAIVGGPTFGQIFSVATGGSCYGGPEQFYAQPMVYTVNNQTKILVASECNNVYIFDGVTGAMLTSRYLGVPFLVSDLGGCNDITNAIGVTGTPVIDPSSDTVYLYSVTYPSGNTGVANARYLLHAMDVNTLAERPNFPVTVDGSPADNQPSRVFEGGKHLQRPALNLISGQVYAAFGGHCDQYNYTGWVIGVDATQGVVTSVFATTASSDVQQYGGGVWEAGGTLSSDNGNRLFILTGNGMFGDLNSTPRTGRTNLNTLYEALASLSIDHTTKKLSLLDWFVPSNAQTLDNSDLDFGSGAFTVFPTMPGTNRLLGAAAGKDGKIYIFDRDNLGGFKTGAAGGDGNIQIINIGSAIYSTIGVSPLDGGWMYVTPLGKATQAYSFSIDNNGNPQFTLAGVSQQPASSAPGVGHMSITSLNDQSGTGILWQTDVGGYQLKAYQAVPVNGQLVPLFLATPSGTGKYQRPSFGNGRAYVVAQGMLYAYGSPVNLPFKCLPSPVDFGQVAVGSNSTINITCIAQTSVTIQSISFFNNTPIFQFGALPSQTQYAQGDEFSVNVTFSPATVNSFGNAVNISTISTDKTFSAGVPLPITGTGLSTKGLLKISPLVLNFQALDSGDPSYANGETASVTVSNQGLSAVTLLGFNFSMTNYNEDSDGDGGNGPDDQYEANNATYPPFSVLNFPTNGTNSSTIPARGSLTLTFKFNPTMDEQYEAYFGIQSTANSLILPLSGAAAGPSKTILLIGNLNGTYNPNTTYMDFGIVMDGTSHTIDMIMENIGGSVLQIDKSKPPIGGILAATSPSSDFAEGLQIAPNSSAKAAVYFEPPLTQPNQIPFNASAIWTLNTNDPTFGVTIVNISGRVLTPQVGPLNAAGQGTYQYLGCFQDSGNSRILPYMAFSDPQNCTIGKCQSACQANGYAFAGLEYSQECWCGTAPPSYNLSSTSCELQCAGDPNQYCGGSAPFTQSAWYDSTRYNATLGNYTDGTPLPVTPKVLPSYGNWSSIGCIAEPSAGGRVFNGTTEQLTTMTIETCLDFCTANGYLFGGTEYASQCYCGNSFANGGGQNVSANACNMACSGNPAELCGGSSVLNAYSYNGAKANVSSATTTTSTTSATTSTTSTIASSSTSTNSSTSTTISTASSSSTSTTISLTSTTTMTSPTTSTTSSSISTTSSIVSTSSTSSTTTTSSTTGVPSVIVAHSMTYQLLGCYNDSTTARALNGSYSQYTSTNTNEVCVQNCASQGFIYAGSEYSYECLCSNTLNNGAVPQPATDCNMLCAGSTTEYCGAGNRLSLYHVGNQSLSSPTTTTTTTTTATTPSSSATPTSSTTTTSSTTGVPSVIVADSMTYQLLGCYNDSTTARALNGSYTQYTSTNTNEVCVQNCASQGFPYAGSEYSYECLCSNSLNNGAVPQPATDCNMLCAGSTTEYCGAGNRLSLYHVGNQSLSSPTTTTTTTTTPSSSSTSVTISVSSTTTTSSTTGVPSVIVADSMTYQLLGCYNDSTTARALNGSYTQYTSTNTNEVCVQNCASQGFPYAGSEYSYECLCSNSLNNGAVPQPATDCNMLCAGSPTEYCGAGNRLSLYHVGNQSLSSPTTTTTTTTTATTPSSSATPTSSTTTTSSTTGVPSVIVADSMTYQLLGCYNDSTTARALNGSYTQYTSTNTNEVCVQNCASQGFPYAGSEYSYECLCSNSLNNGAVPQPATDCNMLCAGSPTEYCGAGNRLSLYRLQGSVVGPGTGTTSSTSTTSTSSSTVQSSSTSSSSTSTAPSATVSPMAPKFVNISSTIAYQLVGCYNDTTAARVMNGSYTRYTNTNTNEVCIQNCASQSFKYGATEYSLECFCSNYLNNYAALQPITDCNMNCAGNSSELCGAGNRLTTYQLVPAA